MGGHAAAPKKRKWWDNWFGFVFWVVIILIVLRAIAVILDQTPRPGNSYANRVAMAPQGTLGGDSIAPQPVVNVRSLLVAPPNKDGWPEEWVFVPRGYRTMNCEVAKEDLESCLSTEKDESKVPYEYRCKLSDGSIPTVWTPTSCAEHAYYQVRSRTENEVYVAHWLVPCDPTKGPECPEPD